MIGYRECHDLQCAAHGRMLRRLRRLQLAVVRERRKRREQARDERGMGWDRAHTMLCHDVYPKCQHRNPWMRVRASS